MKKQRAEIEYESAGLFPAYALGLKIPSGHMYLQNIHCGLPPEDVRRHFEEFAHGLVGRRKQSVINPLLRSDILGSNLQIAPISNVQQLFGLEIERRLLPRKTAALEIHIPTQDRRTFVPVKIVGFRGERALCKARYNGRWLEIELDGKSITQQGLREGDTFEWIPNEEGVLRGADVKSHPRREDVGETERTQRAFDELAEMVQKAGG